MNDRIHDDIEASLMDEMEEIIKPAYQTQPWWCYK